MTEGASEGTKPIIRWAGGKTRLLPELLARVPKTFGRYYEPFAGGAALFFRLTPERAILNDSNVDLILTYKTIARDVEAVIARLEILFDGHTNDRYYTMRRGWNTDRLSWVDELRAAVFIYLNKTNFNGLWRVNADGELNVPAGKFSKPPTFSSTSADGLRAAARVLARAELRCGDYRVAVADAQPGDLVYFDPPYVPLSPTSSFTSYTVDGFGEQQHRELATLAVDLVARGVHALLSNSDTPFTRSLYEGLQVDSVLCGRAINSKGSGRGAVGELVVSGGPGTLGRFSEAASESTGY